MKLQISKGELNLAISRVQGAITERSLSQIGLKASNNTLHVAAMDRVLAVHSKFPCEVESEDTIFVPARKFSETVKELSEGNVTLERQDSLLLIKSGNYKMKMPIIEDLNWHEPPVVNFENTASIPSPKLSYMIDQAQFCVAQESPRNYGTVGYFHKPDSESCRLVGTDGFRLSYCDINVSVPDAFLKNGVCLSKRALTEVSRMCGEGFDSVQLSISDDDTTFVAAVNDYQIFVRLSAVKYPNYSGVLPQTDYAAGVQVSCKELQTITRRVLLAADKSQALQLCFSDSNLTLSSRTMGSTDANDSIQLDDYNDKKRELVVNGKFLTDVFQTTPSERLTLQFNSDEDPMVIVPRDEPADCKSKHVLVPIKESE